MRSFRRASSYHETVAQSEGQLNVVLAEDQRAVCSGHGAKTGARDSGGKISTQTTGQGGSPRGARNDGGRERRPASHSFGARWRGALQE